MLNHLILTSWKSFHSASLSFGPVTLLVGPNASGKSNVIDALRVLQGAALDHPLYEVLRGRWEGGREVWPGIRGGEAEASEANARLFGLATRWDVKDDVIDHSIFVGTEKEVEVHGEELSDGSDAYFFSTSADSLGGKAGHRPGGAIRVAVQATGKGKPVHQTLRSTRSLLGQLEPSDRVASGVYEAARFVRAKLREIVFFDLQPRTMRSSAPIGAPALGVSGENLSAVLHGMSADMRADLVDWVSELCAPSIEGIEFEESKHSRAVFFLLVEKGGNRISSASISDGTLRFMGILTALLTSPSGSLIVFEEPDIGLHPARVHLLAELLEKIPKKRNVQVIATTHSPGLLAHVSDSVLADVLAFGRDPVTNLTVCARVGELPNFEVLRTSRDRASLISTGWLERAV